MRIQRAHQVTVAAAVLTLLALAACGDSGKGPTGPTTPSVAGAYTATTFTTTASGQTTNQLANGASLVLTLTPDGRTTGRLFVPDGDDTGADLDQDLSGTWTLQGSTVRFALAADTFLRDMPFTLKEKQLVGDATFLSGAVRVQVVL